MKEPELRIVSLLPSATEIVCALGLQEYLVGVSHECDFPHGVALLPSVTHTAIPKGLDSKAIDDMVRSQLRSNAALYHLDVDVLRELKPTHIVTQALCDVCAVSAVEVEEVRCQLSYIPQVVNLEPMSLNQVFDTITLLGSATGRDSDAARVVESLNARVRCVKTRSETIPGNQKPRVAMLEWIDPLFNAGHWTPELVEMAGGVDCLGNLNQPSVTLSDYALIGANPDVLFIALCGFDLQRTEQDLPLLQRMPGWKDLSCIKNKRVYYCDGNAYFSRAGPRLVDSLEILAHAINPLVHSIAPCGVVATKWQSDLDGS